MLSNNDILIKWLDFIDELCKKWKVNEDCRSMIILDFLQYDNTKLNKLNSTGEMKFWLVRFVKNYWFSKTSRYYYTYIKPVKDFESLDQLVENEELE